MRMPKRKTCTLFGTHHTAKPYRAESGTPARCVSLQRSSAPDRYLVRLVLFEGSLALVSSSGSVRGSRQWSRNGLLRPIQHHLTYLQWARYSMSTGLRQGPHGQHASTSIFTTTNRLKGALVASTGDQISSMLHLQLVNMT